MEQRTPEWFAIRAGKVTASRIGDLMSKTKTGYSASRANYMAQLVCERLTGLQQESYSNAAMQWGTDQEPIARAEYEALRGVFVEEMGFATHPTIEFAGASPDGLVGNDGLIEIKCPNTATHIETLLSGEPDGKYVKQMMWQMACTGRAWCDFVSFDPRMPENLRLFIKRIQRDDKLIAEIEGEVRKFLAELEEKCNKLKGINHAH
jgi:putative phage-type endonuclease